MPDCPQFFRRTVRFHVRRQAARWHIFDAARWNLPAFNFYHAIRDDGFDLDTWVDVLPGHKLIYVNVPKAASTTIRNVLSRLETSSDSPSEQTLHKRRCSGLLSPRLVGLGAFYDMANSPDTLRFTFVRNPYARLVSAWSNKVARKSPRPGDPYIDLYLDHASPPPDRPRRDEPLSFSEFVHFVARSIECSPDPHWDRQVARTAVRGLKLDLIGRVETFERDFEVVLDHARSPAIAPARLNGSGVADWTSYYSAELARTVYRLYEEDFDAFRYPRSIP